MKKTLHIVVAMIAFGSVAGSAQQARVRPLPEQIPSISMRPTGSSLGTIRVGAADKNIWFDWRVGVPGAAIKSLTLSEMLPKVDVLSVANVEASSSQIGQRRRFRRNWITGFSRANGMPSCTGCKELGEQVLAYRVDSIGADEATRRKVFEFAKAIGAPTHRRAGRRRGAGGPRQARRRIRRSTSRSRARAIRRSSMRAVEGRGKRVGVAADLGGWMQAGVKPVDGLPIVKDRLMLVNVADRSALGAGGRDVALGTGAGGLGDFFLAAWRAGVKPLLITVQSTGHERGRPVEEPERRSSA